VGLLLLPGGCAIVVHVDQVPVDQEGAASVFSVTSESVGGHLEVVVTGEVDMATADAMVQAATREGAERLTLDLRRVTFFDSAAIHAVVRLGDAYPAAMTVHPSRQVRRVLDISGLGDQPWLATD
jgi:stage II sporulation protein AA (anti-sigma F factor antagonist)